MSKHGLGSADVRCLLLKTLRSYLMVQVLFCGQVLRQDSLSQASLSLLQVPRSFLPTLSLQLQSSAACCSAHCFHVAFFTFSIIPPHGQSILTLICQAGSKHSLSFPLVRQWLANMLNNLSLDTHLDFVIAILRNIILRDKICDCPQPYSPSLSASWLFQRSMSLRPGQLRQPRGR